MYQYSYIQTHIHMYIYIYYRFYIWVCAVLPLLVSICFYCTVHFHLLSIPAVCVFIVIRYYVNLMVVLIYNIFFFNTTSIFYICTYMCTIKSLHMYIHLFFRVFSSSFLPKLKHPSQIGNIPYKNLILIAEFVRQLYDLVVRSEQYLRRLHRCLEQ